MIWEEPLRSWSFTVPGPPVPCARVRVVRRGPATVAVTPDKTKAYKKQVGWLALAARPKDWPLGPKARYGLVVEVHRAHASGDADNFLKTFSDALNKIAWSDDARVCRMAARVYDTPSRPMAAVTVELLDAG